MWLIYSIVAVDDFVDPGQFSVGSLVSSVLNTEGEKVPACQLPT